MKKKMLKERKPIEVIVKVETLKNGYSLDVDGKSICTLMWLSWLKD